jgi:dienelactone hydrolase
VIVLAFITFRSWQAVVVAVLPLMLTSVLCEALMVWLGMGVKVATLPVIALGVGIGVDYALYILTVTLAAAGGMSLSEAYYKALHLHRQGGGAHRRDWLWHRRRHLGLVAHQVPGRHGHPAGLHVHLEHARRPGAAAGPGAFSAQAVTLPYEGKEISALWYPADGLQPGQRAPVLVQLNGLDSTKEMKHLVGLPKWMAQRGVSSLVVDQPGTGEALRLHGLTARFDAEHWAGRVVDYLESRDDVDPRRIGCEGVSLGGYYCPRAVAMEPRFAAGVCWGANHDWRDVQKRRLEREGDFPVPHYWAHVCWVWGAKDIDDFMRIAEDVHLDGVVEKIRVPFLVTHGERDSQIPLKWAHRTYEQLVNSPQRELKVFTDREGGVQHASFDNSINAGHYIADWMARALGGRTA